MNGVDHGNVRTIADGQSGKRLKGLDEFVKPGFVGRMDRLRRRRERVFVAMLITAILVGASIGWTLV